MTTREATELASEDHEPPNKRPRLQENRPAASLDSLNDDCILLVLSYLPTDDLNSIAICSRRYGHARSHESLDQSRPGTLTILEGTTLDAIRDRIVSNNWSQAFQGNRTHLKVDRLERLSRTTSESFAEETSPRALISGVTSLGLAFMRRTDYSFTNHNSSLLSFFPNLREIDLSSEEMASPYNFFVSLSRCCPYIEKITWNDNERAFGMLNGSCLKHVSRLTQLYLDDFCFSLYESEIRRFSDTTNEVVRGSFAFSQCPHQLERLSMKNATYRIMGNVGTEEIQPLPQEVLVKMARYHPALRWLRSDLSAENVAMLQQERPDITFVSE